MRLTKVAVVLAMSTALALPLWAQTRGDGADVGIGRQGAAWQTQLRNEQDEIANLEAELLELDRDAWMEKAVAWIEFDFSQEKRINVADSSRVAKVDPGKKAEVEEFTVDPPTWGIAWGKKAPRSLKLILTDTNSTQIECPLAARTKMEAGFMGVFVLENAIVCLPRAPFPEAEDDEPAP